MQPFWMIIWFFTKVVLGAAVLFFALLRLADPRGAGTATLLSAGNLWLILYAAVAYLTSFAAFLADEVYFYPYYRNPLRKLPTLYGGYNGRIVTERPRGKTPLRWMTENPDVNLIHSRGKLGQSVLYPVAPDALRDILSTNSYDFEKPWGMRKYLGRMTFMSGLLVTEGQHHKAQRRGVSWAFAFKHIRSLYPVMWTKAGVFVRRLEQVMAADGQIELTAWASRFAFDIIGIAGFSEEFDALGRDDYHPVAKAIAVALEPEHYMVAYMSLSLFFPSWLMERVPMKGNKVLSRELKTAHAFCKDLLDRKLARVGGSDEKEDKDILYKVIRQGELSRHEMQAQIQTILGAGHETSAASITWAGHLLSLPENVHCQATLRDEVRAALPCLADGSFDFSPAASERLAAAIETLPYLNGACEEVLRLFPSVPTTVREAVRQTTINGTVIPKGTFIVISIYAINRNPRFWGLDADKFRPERWIDTLPDGSQRINKTGGAESSFCETTFLHGQHACIGREFARAELKVALAAMFGMFDVARLPGDDGSVRVIGAVTTKPKGGLSVRLTRAAAAMGTAKGE